MPYKDKAQATDWMRRKRAGLKKVKEEAAAQHTEHTESNMSTSSTLTREMLKPPMEVRLRKASDLLDVLEAAMAEILSSDSEPIVKGRAVAYLVEKACKLIEIVDLAEKVAALQKKVNEGGASTNWHDSSY
jgi:hypothetical protein